MIKLQAPTAAINASVLLPTSKSLANRIILLQALSKQELLKIESEPADDIAVFINAITTAQNLEQATINIGAAGTAMRFLTAYLSQQKGTWLLIGTERMLQRPIGPLVQALKTLGADISYTNKEGFPPLLINGTRLHSASVTVEADISSQFVTALLLLAPFIEGGLQLQLKGNVVSAAYVQMSLQLLKEAGVTVAQTSTQLNVHELKSKPLLPQHAEGDWSAASYYFSICALAKDACIVLKGVNEKSLQGDRILPQLYSQLGVNTSFDKHGLTLRSTTCAATHFSYNFIDCPDLAQTLAVTCFGLGISAELSGLQTLKHKETDRLLALKTELEKCGAIVEISEHSLTLQARKGDALNSTAIATYKDHRMAMSFAPLALLVPHLTIEDESVVNKSYPQFWKHLLSLGFNVNLQPH
jgi:3-phosphoshikimate 1-carboxyvinyltransferase